MPDQQATPDTQNRMMNASGWGNIGSGLFNLFGANNPADAAGSYLNQIGPTISPYYNPYIQAGQGALNTLQGEYGHLLGGRQPLQDQFNQLMQNPGDFLNKIGQGYQKSPGYQFNVDEATRGANQAAAAGGMLGTPASQQALAKRISGISSQDYGNWMNNALGLHNQGLQGNQGLYGAGLSGTQGLNQMGFQASDSLARQLADALMSQAKLQYAGGINQNQQEGGGLGSLLGGIGNIFGGPAGGGIGSMIGNIFK